MLNYNQKNNYNQKYNQQNAEIGNCCVRAVFYCREIIPLSSSDKYI